MTIIYNKVNENFKKLFENNGKKIEYDIDDNRYYIKEEVIERELKKLKKDKGIAWDYIPQNSVINLLDNEVEE